MITNIGIQEENKKEEEIKQEKKEDNFNDII